MNLKTLKKFLTIIILVGITYNDGYFSGKQSRGKSQQNNGKNHSNVINNMATSSEVNQSQQVVAIDLQEGVDNGGAEHNGVVLGAQNIENVELAAQIQDTSVKDASEVSGNGSVTSSLEQINVDAGSADKIQEAVAINAQEVLHNESVTSSLEQNDGNGILAANQNQEEVVDLIDVESVNSAGSEVNTAQIQEEMVVVTDAPQVSGNGSVKDNGVGSYLESHQIQEAEVINNLSADYNVEGSEVQNDGNAGSADKIQEVDAIDAQKVLGNANIISLSEQINVDAVSVDQIQEAVAIDAPQVSGNGSSEHNLLSSEVQNDGNAGAAVNQIQEVEETFEQEVLHNSSVTSLLEQNDGDGSPELQINGNAGAAVNQIQEVEETFEQRVSSILNDSLKTVDPKLVTGVIDSPLTSYGNPKQIEGGCNPGWEKYLQDIKRENYDDTLKQNLNTSLPSIEPQPHTVGDPNPKFIITEDKSPAIDNKKITTSNTWRQSAIGATTLVALTGAGYGIKKLTKTTKKTQLSSTQEDLKKLKVSPDSFEKLSTKDGDENEIDDDIFNNIIDNN